MVNFFVSFYFLCIINVGVRAFLFDDDNPSVHTKYGEIQGQVKQVNFDGKQKTIRKFLGIPYAKPPIGNLRFRKPEMMTSLPALPFQALKLGPVCPQPNLKVFGLTSSEDCLFLNIYTPVISLTSKPKPVMVYIHGGGFTLGFSDVYDGSVLSAYSDVILVAMNYRIGPLGFFNTNDGESPGNFGLWDQQLAIKWVAENIEAFGGDNSSITIFGESAGGSSVIYQTLYPGNKGLIKRAIAESGTVAAWGVNRFDANYKTSMDFARYVGCNESDSVMMVTCLRNKSSDDMRKHTEEYEFARKLDLVNKPWVPVYDGDFVLSKTDQLIEAIGDISTASNFTTFHDVDLMIGATKFDGNVFLTNWLSYINESTYGPTTGYFGITSDQFEHVIMPMAAAISLREVPSTLALEAVKFEYTAWDDPDNLTKIQENLVKIGTDFGLNAPSVATAKAHSNSKRTTYLYQFSTASLRNFLPLPPALMNEYSAGHADEVGFVFGFPLALLLPFGATLSSVTAEQMRVSKAVMAMWTNFVKTG